MHDLLTAAIHNETEEAEDVYPAFAAIAREEGFQRAADVFAGIAKIEHLHAARFRQYDQLMQADQLFTSQGEVRWLCLNCGHIHVGPQAPALCPVCRHDQGHFIRADLSPFVLP